MRRDLAARRSQIATTRRGPLLGSREDLLREPGITRRTMMHYRRSRHNGTFLQMSKARPQKSTLEAQRIGTDCGDHRLRQSMSFAVIKKATARASWATRWTVLRSVFRRSWP